MSKISIINRELAYGIPVEDIFWVQQNVLTKEMVRESRDEEIVADLLAHMTLVEIQPSRGERFDEFFGLVISPRYEEIESAVLRIGADILTTHFLYVYNELRETLDIAARPFAQLVLGQAVQRVPRYFQVVFLAMYELLVRDNSEIVNRQRLCQILDDSGEQMNISAGGGTWAAQEKERNINAIKGLISPCFRSRKTIDPATSSWVTQLETILRQSYTEQNLYDFKQGFCTLDHAPHFDEEAFGKAMSTLTAIANYGLGARGYVLVGITDTAADAERVRVVHGVTAQQFGAFNITGIAHEAPILGMNIDRYFRFIVQKIGSQPISGGLKDYILRNLKLVRYYDKAVIVLESEAQREPCAYDDIYYVRHGASNAAVAPSNLGSLFAKFLRQN